MATTSINPHWRWRVLTVRGYIDAAFRRRGETAFHVVAALALLGILLWAAAFVLHAMAEDLRQALQRWPIAIGLLLLLVCGVSQVRGLRRLAALRACDWLASQPIAAVSMRQDRLLQVLQRAVLQSLAGAALLLGIDSAATYLAWLVAVVMLAAAVAFAMPARGAALSAIGVRGRHPQGTGRGHVLRWQWIEAGAARFGPALAPGAFALLLVPMGSGVVVVGASLLVGLLCAGLLSAWRRSLAVIPFAQAWLGAQPLSGPQLLREAYPLPMLLLILAMGLLLAAGLGLRLGPAAGLASLSLGALGALHLLCVMVERRRPRRIALVFTVQLALLLVLARTIPPLLPLLWLAQMYWLLRRLERE